MSDSNIRIFPIITDKDLPADAILQAALGELDQVVILGYDKDGEEFFSSSVASGPEVNWLLDRAKQKLQGIINREDED